VSRAVQSRAVQLRRKEHVENRLNDGFGRGRAFPGTPLSGPHRRRVMGSTARDGADDNISEQCALVSRDGEGDQHGIKARRKRNASRYAYRFTYKYR
jgi:hypothetical protein